MLSEGWDAKNVTHIMGLARIHQPASVRTSDRSRVTARVLRHGRKRPFLPEYVNVLRRAAIDFQDVGEGGDTPPPPKPSTQIEALPERASLEIKWPNASRVPEQLSRWVDFAQLELGSMVIAAAQRTSECRAIFAAYRAQTPGSLHGKARFVKISFDRNRGSGSSLRWWKAIFHFVLHLSTPKTSAFH